MKQFDTSDALLLVGLLCSLAGLYAMFGWPVVLLVLGVILMAVGVRMAAAGAK